MLIVKQNYTQTVPNFRAYNIIIYNNECSFELFIKLAMTVFFKRQQHRKLSWLDKDSDKNQSQFDELFN
jgi:hypothetical protein